VDAAPVPIADLEPSDAGPPAWPGWPLPTGKTITPAMICQNAFAPSADLHDNCMREADPQRAVRSYLDDALIECVSRLERSILNGRASVDPTAAERCIAKTLDVRRSGRTEIATNEHACDGAIVGRQEVGAKCHEEWECAPGLACTHFTKQSPGKCATAAGDKGVCVTGSLHFDALERACATGLWCAADRCAPREKEGASCLPGSCLEGLFCTSGTHRCAKALGRNDAACKRSEDCELGFYCAIAQNQARCAPQKGVGAKCLEGIECLGDCRANRCVSICGSP